ncbi:membrane protein insertase YidC [Aestuariispira ectoiniformans]|uniref:membrane protein insertase YidC n=1 Tax=Aestuariispira ectoiniformans TaxID=2775080 RepID=UPI0021E43CAC|nr:membrane protein insertase YidC [Aestuariispira ectoiniformans]
MDQKNVVLAVVLSIAILVGWNLYEQSQVKDLPPPQETAEGTATPAPASASNAQATTQPQVGGAATAVARDRKDVLVETPRVTIKAPKLSGSINLKGARVDDLTLSEYEVDLDHPDDKVVLLQPAGSQNPYFVNFNWWLDKGFTAPDNNTVWTADSDTLAPGKPVTLSWTNPQGVTFQQILGLDDDYMFSVKQRIVNNSGKPVQAAPYGLISRIGTPKVLGYYLLHEGMLGVFNDKLEEIKYKDLKDEPTAKNDTTGGWLGITDKYWLTALVPDQKSDVKTSFRATPRGDDFSYQADFLAPATTIAAGATQEMGSHFFAGAKKKSLLDQYAEEYQIPKFDLAIDFGYLYFLTKPIFYAIHWLHSFLGNFGLAIIVLTFGIKALLFPLANKSYRSMSKMKLLQPKMQEMKERYADDRQKLNQEMMQLYKKEKVNPLAGCLPIVFQIPIFFSLYKTLFVTIEMRHAPFFGWIHDLSAPDPLGVLTLFGTIDWSVPASLHILNIGIWPLIMGFTMWLQQRLNPSPADPVQAKVFMFMPIIFTFMLGRFPAGLVIYWATNNTLSIIQQWLIMKRMGVAIGGGKAEAS